MYDMKTHPVQEITQLSCDELRRTRSHIPTTFKREK